MLQYFCGRSRMFRHGALLCSAVWAYGWYEGMGSYDLHGHVALNRSMKALLSSS